jgi:FKBP-type peptidyl-prolyl cis-trans isomerase FkpA
MACNARWGLVLGLVLGCFAACGGKPAQAPQSAPGPQALQIIDLQNGDGASVSPGQRAVLQYTGWLYDASAPEHKGKQFDSSRGGPAPFRFMVGRGEVIKGWDQGVAGMKIGGRRRLIIPPDLAYGDNGAGGVIPPAATLVFDVDLLAIE